MFPWVSPSDCTPNNGLKQGSLVWNWPFGALESAISFMGPSNDHELEIAREVDRLALREDLTPAAAPEILALLGFRMSSTDSEFMERYIQWRKENPIVR
jgi:hypothetical protein